MKTKKIALMVIIFSCVTSVFLSHGAQACVTVNDELFFVGCRWCCCSSTEACAADEPPGKTKCNFLNFNTGDTNPECTFNFYCLTHPIYCCASSTALNNDEAKLDVLRQMRDIRMARTVLGRSLIKLYYKHSLEMTTILLSDEDLLSFVSPVVSEIAEKAVAFNNHEKVSVDHALIEDTLAVADLINEKASPELKAAIQRVRKQIKSGYIFRNFGITIND